MGKLNVDSLCVINMSSILTEKFYILHRFKVPEGLVYLLANYKLREGETPVAGLARLYRNVFLKLWVSEN